MIDIYYGIQVEAENFFGCQKEDGSWVATGAFSIPVNSITFEEADKLSNEAIDGWLKEYEVTKVISRRSHTQVKLDWYNSYIKDDPLKGDIINMVYPDLSDKAKIKYGFGKIWASTMSKVAKKGLLKTCPRCGGTGHYSRTSDGNTTCFKCNGFKYVIPTKISKKFYKSVEKTFDISGNNSYNKLVNKNKEEMLNMNLTAMEIKILNAMRKNEFDDGLDVDCVWVFSVIENSGIEGTKARGVISSLVKKGLVFADGEVIGYTEEGRKVFDNADGEECNWGGPKLLKEIPDKPEEISYNENVDKTNKKEEVNDMKDLNTMKAVEIKELAKELKVKNWWTMKKADLIAAIQQIQQPQEEKVEEVQQPAEPEEKAEQTKITLDLTDVKEPEKKDEPKAEPKTREGKFTLKMILEELNMNGKKARRILRNKEVVKPGKQWEWDNEEEFKKVKDLLSK